MQGSAHYKKNEFRWLVKFSVHMKTITWLVDMSLNLHTFYQSRPSPISNFMVQETISVNKIIKPKFIFWVRGLMAHYPRTTSLAYKSSEPTPFYQQEISTIVTRGLWLTKHCTTMYISPNFWKFAMEASWLPSKVWRNSKFSLDTLMVTWRESWLQTWTWSPRVHLRTFSKDY